MAGGHMPFALFVLVDISTETLDKLLRDALKSAGVYIFWVATPKFSDAPKKEEQTVHEGERPPLAKDYKGFIGKTVEEVADVLRNKPEDVDLDAFHFAILDRTAEDGDIVLGRVGGKAHDVIDKLDLLRFGAETAAGLLRGGPPGWWEDARREHGQADIRY